MKILVVHKGDLNRQPPALSLCHHLSDLGLEVAVFTNHLHSADTAALESKHVSITLLPELSLPGKGLANKIGRWLSFNRHAWRAIRSTTHDALWVTSADTALALGRRLQGHKYVLHVHELYDKHPFYRKKLASYMRRAAAVVVPDEVRAHIVRVWYDLIRTPIVLPNKPHYHPRTRSMTVSDPEAAAVLRRLPPDAKTVFYQGGITAARDIKPFAKAVELLGEPWRFLVQSPPTNNPYYLDFVRNYNAINVPYVPAPRHLEVTSRAYIGLLTYAHSSLNNELCAPNKIWEYSGFGLPMIANDVYGLKTVERRRIGLSVNTSQAGIAAIAETLTAIDASYMEMSRNSSAFYEDLSLQQILSDLVESLR